MKLQTWANEARGRGLLLAKALGVQPPSVSEWITGKKAVPLGQCMAIERATNGAVTRRDLRPHNYFEIWPELVTSDQATTQQTQAQAAPEAVANGGA